MENAVRVYKVFDSPDFDDRYTVYYEGHHQMSVTMGGAHVHNFVSMNSLGMCYHGEAEPVAYGENEREIQFSDLPVVCQNVVNAELKELNAYGGRNA